MWAMCRERLRFAREARQPIGIGREQLRQDLQRDIAIELRVTRAVDLSHPAGAKWGEDFVRTDSGASRQGHAAKLILLGPHRPLRRDVFHASWRLCSSLS
jgi:hypothetical protein